MTERIIRFGPFELRPEREQLLNAGARVSLGSRALAILALLAERAGEIVSIQEINEHVWPNLFVQENNLRVHMSSIRRALRTASEGDAEIVNVPGRGYRLSAEVTLESAGEDAPRASRPQDLRPLPPPLQVNHLVGRADIVAQLGESLRRHRLVTVVGPGGVGKTSVALAALNVLPANAAACFIDLTNCASIEHVAAAAAAALQSPMGRDATPTVLIDRLRDIEILLVLDNCEHLIDVVARVAETVLRSCPRVRLLATSREPLRVPGEMQAHLQPLPVPAAADTVQAISENPAVLLFAERAEAAAGGFSVTQENAGEVAAVCRSLDGLPLALELAAAAVPIVGLNTLSSGLTQRLALLAFGRRTLARHETLEAMLDWSFELLSPAERAVLSFLGVFRASFDLTAAVSVAALEQDDESKTARAVLRLAAKSLLLIEPSSQGMTYRLLETTKAYARRKLQESGQSAIAARRHAEWVRELLARAKSDWRRLDRAVWWDRYGNTIDDVRAALIWSLHENGDTRLSISLTIASAPLWLGVSQFAEYNSWLEEALATLDTLGETGGYDEVQLQIGLCVLLFNADRPDERFVRAAKQVLRIGERIGDPLARATGLWLLSGERALMADHPGALALARRMLAAAATPEADVELRMFARRVVALMTFRVGEVTKSAEIGGELVANLPSQSAYGAVLRYDHSTVARGNHAVTLAVQGRLDSARNLIMDAVIDAQHLRNPNSFSFVLSSAACPIMLWLGDNEQAQRYAGMLANAAEANGFSYVAELAAWYSAIADLRLGKPAWSLAPYWLKAPPPHDKDVFITTHAALCDVEDVARVEACPPHWATAEILRAHGEARLRAGDKAAARTLFERALSLAEAQGAGLWALRAATSLAGLAEPDTMAGVLEAALARIEGDDRYPDVLAAKSLLTAFAG